MDCNFIPSSKILQAMRSSLLAGVLTASATSVFGLGLGEIAVESSLNEPFIATISLEDLDGVAADEITVMMGTQQDFDLVGFERTESVEQIEFAIQVDSLADGTLSLSTDTSIDEPFLSFILDVSWPSGRLLREYTVLIDLPTFTENTAAPQVPAAPSVSNEGEVIVIQSGDSLWQLAQQARTDSSVSVQQMMIALQSANPEAFINNNINRIRTGAILRVPSREDVLAYSQQQAVNQVAIQNQQVGLSNQPLAALNTITGATEPNGGDELSVLTSTNGNANTSVIADLQNELAMSEENLDRSRIENEDLTSRLEDLQAEIEILQNIIAIEDERVAQLQVQLAEEAELATQALADAQAAASQAAAVAEEAATMDDSLKAKINALFQNTYVMVAMIWILIVMVIGFLIWRSRKAGGEEGEELDSDEIPLTDEEDDAGSENGPSLEDASAVAALEEEISELNFDDENADEDDSEALFAMADSDDAMDEAAIDELQEDDFDFEQPEQQEDLEEDFDEGLDEGLEGEPETEVTTEEVEPDEDITEDLESDENDEEGAQEDFSEVVPEQVKTMDFSMEEFLADEEEAHADNERVNDEGNTENIEGKPSEENDTEIEFSMPDLDSDLDTEEPKLAAEADELDKNSEAIDAEDEIEEIEFSNSTVKEVLAAESSNDETIDDVESLEFTVPEVAIENVTEEEASNEASEDAQEVESLEFSVDSVPEAAQEPAVEDVVAEDTVESFEFSVDEASESVDEGQESTETSEEDDVEVMSFNSSSDDAIDLDLDVDDELEIISDFDGSDTDKSESDKDASTDDDFLDFGNVTFNDDELSDEPNDAELVEAITDDKDASSGKLDLAVAYEGMGDIEGAREILAEVIAESNDEQAAEAYNLLEKWKESD